MSEINGKRLRYGAVTGPLFVEGIGQFGPSLSTTATGSKVTKMTVDEPWVIVEMKDQVGKTVTVPVPLTSFTHTVLTKE